MDNLIHTVRHFEDENDLTRGLDTTLLVDQGESIENLCKGINERFKASGKGEIQIITSDQNRTLGTAELILNGIKKFGTNDVEIVKEPTLRGLNQGVPNLPGDYKPGDDFPALKLAWGPFWEHVENGDIFYRFGQAEIKDGLEYEELKGKFKELGESYAELLLRHLEFIHSLLTNEAISKFQILIGHSINIRIIKELIEISKNHNSILNPIKLGDIARLMEENWDGKRHEFGELETLDITSLKEGLFIDELDQEIQILKAKMFQNGIIVE